MRGFLNQLIYFTDNALSKGTFNIIFFLVLIILSIVGMLSLIVWSLGLNDQTIYFDTFSNFIFKVIRYYPSDNPYFMYEIINFFLFLTGMFITAGLIGAITTGLSDKLSQLRNSSSIILEKNHTVILGFSSHVISIIKELILANESEKNPCVVVLGRTAKDEMFNTIKKNIKDFKNTKIIFREGDRRIKNDLDQLNLNDAKAIIINNHSHQNSDVSKTLLAIINKENRKKGKYHIVAVVNNKEDATLCKLIGKDEVEIIESNNFLARLEAQTCRQSGLPLVYEKILNFAGDEFYFKKEKSLIDKKFSEVINYYNKSSIIGYFRNDKVFLNPKGSTLIKKEDQLIGLSKDNSTFILDNPDSKPIIKKNFSKSKVISSTPEYFLFLGSNDYTDNVLALLGKYTTPKSKCDIIIEGNKRTKTKTYNNLSVNYIYTSNINRPYLNKIDFNQYNFVVVQSFYDTKIKYDMNVVDNKSLSLIINLRDLKNINNYSFKIISELFDSNNHDLIQNSQIDDFILSEKFISSSIAQVTENKKLSLIFHEIFSPSGSEIYIRPAENYINLNKEVNFFEISNSTLTIGEVAIGYKLERFSKVPLIKFNGKELNYGVVINPIKSETINFEKGDQIIVFAND